MSAPPATPAAAVTRAVVTLPERFPARRAWWIAMLVALTLLTAYAISAAVLLTRGPGVWGSNTPVVWGFDIMNYIWWLGIGHAGTLISAALLLTGQTWRSALNRFAEAMTLFAAACAGLYPILHLGRPWRFYWMAPYPNTMQLWPQFKSPLSWDFFAVTTYFTVSLLFWYIGFIPDLALARDQAKKRRWQILFGLGALGWRGSARHWARWQQAYRIIAALAVPLVAMVTASYALLLAGGPVHGWANSIFPAYFLAGAVFSGFAVVAMLAVGLRSLLGLEQLITPAHLDRLGMLLLATGLLTLYGYAADAFTAAYAGGQEWETLVDRAAGPYAWSYWGALLLNFAPLQLLWWRRWRTHPLMLLLVGAAVAVGMWMERFMLLVTGLYRDWLPSNTHGYAPTVWDWSLFAGSVGLFLTLFLLFVRFLPVISAYEVAEERSGG